MVRGARLRARPILFDSWRPISRNGLSIAKYEMRAGARKKNGKLSSRLPPYSIVGPNEICCQR